MNRPRTALIADDHQLVAAALGTLLEGWGWDVLDIAGDGVEAVRLARRLSPDVAVLDVKMPRLDGLEAARRIVRACPGTAVVLLTAFVDPRLIARAERSGASVVVSKTDIAHELARVLDEVAERASGPNPPLDADPLTPRQRSLVRLVAEGRTTKEAAAALGITRKTAEAHRTQAMQRLGVHDTAGLVRYAVRKGLIRP
jgi:DNA-binding NarL/FixJ family response regulator